MDFEASVKAIGAWLKVNIPPPDEEGIYQWKQEEHLYRIFQRNHKWYWECSWGTPLEDTYEHRLLLHKILQFNLKRMRFLNATVYLEPSCKQLFLQQAMEPETIKPENLEEAFNDFVLNREVMEEQFFPEKLT